MIKPIFPKIDFDPETNTMRTHIRMQNKENKYYLYLLVRKIDKNKKFPDDVNKFLLEIYYCSLFGMYDTNMYDAETGEQVMTIDDDQQSEKDRIREIINHSF